MLPLPGYFQLQNCHNLADTKLHTWTYSVLELIGEIKLIELHNWFLSFLKKRSVICQLGKFNSVTKLNKKGEIGQPCLTPLLIWNLLEVLKIIITKLLISL